MSTAQYVAVYVCQLSNNTVSAGPCPLPLLVRYERVLARGETWEFPLNVTVTRTEVQGKYTAVTELKVNDTLLTGLRFWPRAGRGYRMIFELWLYDSSSESFRFAGSWGRFGLSSGLT
jgi:hypothetical protein